MNWDPVDETVLANEQVDAEGRSWRCTWLYSSIALNTVTLVHPKVIRHLDSVTMRVGAEINRHCGTAGYIYALDFKTHAIVCP